MQHVIRKSGTNPHVAIIGAGFAGLRCADVLLKRGAKVTIYEARDRVGGRVHQEMLEGRLMDMGPNWIHGTENNPICTLASKTDTVLHDFDPRMTIVDSKGKKFPAKEGMHIFDTAWKIIGKAFKYSEEYKDSIDPSTSLFDFFKEQVPQFEPDPKIQSSILEMAQEWGSFIGDPVTSQSLKFFFLESVIDGATLFVASTYRSILHEVARPALAKATIHFNEEVLSITSNPSDPHPINLTTNKSPSVSYDEVIVTCPLGYLKHHKTTLFPQPSLLAPRLSTAIDNMHYGDLEKIYLTYPSAWWAEPPEPPPSSSSFSTSDPPSSFTFMFTPSPAPFPPPTPPSQSLEFVSLAHPSFPASCSQPTLLLYTYPPLSRILSALSPSDLLKTLTPYLSRIPNYSPTSENCTPTSLLATSWNTDRLAGYGSYTNFPVGVTEGDVDVRVLRESEGTGQEKGVWFAGEHTAPVLALGTTTGAYWAGEEVATKVAGLWGLVMDEDGDGGEGVKEVVDGLGRDPVPRRL